MATFVCERHPTLLVIGAGRFQSGKLTVTGRAAEKVRAAARTLGIIEVDDERTDSNPVAEAQVEVVPEEELDGDEVVDLEDADESDGEDETPAVPRQNANKQELTDWLVEHGDVEDASELDGLKKDELWERITSAAE